MPVLSPIPEPAPAAVGPAVVGLLRYGHAVAYAVLGDRHDADEAVQTAAVRVLLRSERLELLDDFRRYFRAVVVNCARAMLHRRREDARLLAKLRYVRPLYHHCRAGERAQANELRAALDRALVHVAPKPRAAMLARLRGLTGEELAKSLRLTPAAARRRLTRVRRQLRRTLGPRWQPTT